MASDDERQDLRTRAGALAMALDECLARLAVLYGNKARGEIEALRDELIHKFKNSTIPAEREMEHAKIVRPALEVLEAVFEDALRNLPEGDINPRKG